MYMFLHQVYFLNFSSLILNNITGGLEWSQASAPQQGCAAWGGGWTSIASDRTGKFLAAVMFINNCNNGDQAYTSTNG